MCVCVCVCVGARLLKARAGLIYSRGEQRGSREVLEKKFNDYCAPNDIPYEENPFFTCVLRRGWYKHILSVSLCFPFLRQSL